MVAHGLSTFAALIQCFSADLAALVSEEAPHDLDPVGFIHLVERARDVLAATGGTPLQGAQECLDRAASRLTDALTSSGADQRSLLVRARMYLREATDTTC
ncbi:hypothetical protein [Streptomyces chartreusis]|uniref:hypothetical protein n=1 Tax=Streptomyces chartreusis TaxID=1969 RepID=UPI0037A7AEEA